jgi:hypothetical protein
MKPNQIVLTKGGEVKELISHPYPEGDETHIKVRDPGDPTTMTTANVNDLVEVMAVCRIEPPWIPFCVGEFDRCHIDCPTCDRGYYARHDATGKFLHFESDRRLPFVVPKPKKTRKR